MKLIKKLTVMAVAGVASTVAQAQSNVTMYGVIDLGITAISNEGGGRNYKLDDSIASGNRLGFKGSEDLGGELKAIFTLENGFNAANGNLRQGGRLFGRQSFVGLSNQLGTLTLGRQYDLIYDYTSNFNISAWTSAYAGHQGDLDRMGWERVDNAVKFTSANFGGLKFGLMYALGEVAGDTKRGSTWSAGGQYTAGPFAVASAYTHLNNPSGSNGIDPFGQIGVKRFLGQTVAQVDPVTGVITDLFSSTPLNVDSQGIFTIGSSYVFGAFTLMGNYTNDKFKGFGTESTMRTYDVGGAYQFTPALIGLVSYMRTTFEDARWNQTSASLDYNLSKRTDVYLAASYLNASSNVNAVSGGLTAPSSTGNQTTLRVGFRHRF